VVISTKEEAEGLNMDMLLQDDKEDIGYTYWK
jgi:hypothetical protein